MLKETRLIEKLAEFLLRLDDPKNLLFSILCGDGNFCEMSLRVRQFVAQHVWFPYDATKHTCSLSSFLSSFRDKFDMFKDSLVGMDANVVAQACVEILLGVNCVILSENDRKNLLGSMKLLFIEDSLIQTACRFCEKLPPNPSTSEILKVAEEYPSLRNTIFKVLKSFPKHMNYI